MAKNVFKVVARLRVAKDKQKSPVPHNKEDEIALTKTDSFVAPPGGTGALLPPQITEIQEKVSG